MQCVQQHPFCKNVSFPPSPCTQFTSVQMKFCAWRATSLGKPATSCVQARVVMEEDSAGMREAPRLAQLGCPSL